MVRFSSANVSELTDGAMDNRGTFCPENPCACIASACAMWAWDKFGAMVDGELDNDYPIEGHCGLIQGRNQ
jgi:hypothetical protein